MNFLTINYLLYLIKIRSKYFFKQNILQTTNNKMEKTSHLLLLSITLFLSTFFVGCKPQEEPIALEDINLESTKKIAEKTSSVEEAVQIEQQQSAENQFEFTDTVESTTNVVLKGYAFLSTGFPVTNGFFVDVVQAKESKVKTFSCKIRPEIDGSITISNLMLGNAELQFSLPGCNSLKTNIYLYSDLVHAVVQKSYK